MNALQIQFIQEGRELLEQISESMLKLERSPNDTETLNQLFRCVHTLKGNTGLFEELKPLSEVLHAAEDTLDTLREEDLQLTSVDADLLLDAMDFAAEVMDQWERDPVPDERWTARAQSLSTTIRQSRAHGPLNAAQAEVAEQFIHTEEQRTCTDWTQALLCLLPPVQQDLVLVRYTPEEDCFFKGEDPIQWMRSMPGLIRLHARPLGSWPSAEAMDIYQCRLELLAASTATQTEIEPTFQYVADRVSYCAVSSTDRPSDSPFPHTPPLPAVLRRSIRKIWQAQWQMLSCTQGQGHWQGKAESVSHVIAGLAHSVGRPQWALAVQEAMDVSIQAGSPHALLAWLERMPSALMDEDEPINTPPIQNQTAPTQLTPVNTPRADAEPVDADPKSLPVLKVPREKVDRLMELIGEMVVAKNALPYLADKIEKHHGLRDITRELKTHYSVINRIAEEMQDAIMQVRMLPVGSVFQRFPRLVRDLSKKLGKRVRLDIHGEDTEADKNMIEALAEPLIHLIRNSLDHGIEPPEDRLSAGKPEEGLIRISASQDSDRIRIRIEDDGAGIDSQRVKDKALQKGLISPEKHQSMSQADAQQLIFMPGFSTADTVSDVSGRGVGMDVVRSTIARVNGHIHLSSEWGKGTQIELSLPLTMAVTQAMVIRSAGQAFGVPMDRVVETVRVHARDIHRVGQHQATVLRGKIVPLVSLNDALGLGLPQAPNADEEFAVLVIRGPQETIGVVVDDFDSTLDILLRPLEGPLTHLRVYAGSALLGDGSILLVLDPNEVFA